MKIQWGKGGEDYAAFDEDGYPNGSGRLIGTVERDGPDWRWLLTNGRTGLNAQLEHAKAALETVYAVTIVGEEPEPDAGAVLEAYGRFH